MSPLWIGETWVCQNEYCRFVNAVIRKKCRNCGALRAPENEKTITLPERVAEFREWEVHHRRWAMHSLDLILQDLGKPELIALHGGLASHVERVRLAATEIMREFNDRYSRGLQMSAVQLRRDR